MSAGELNKRVVAGVTQRAARELHELGYGHFAVCIVAGEPESQHTSFAVRANGVLDRCGDAMNEAAIAWLEQHLDAKLEEASSNAASA